MNTARKSYPSDVSDAEWEFLLPYLSLMREDAPQREYPLRDLFNAIRYVVRTGCQWRFLPHDLPPWTAVYQQARHWMQANKAGGLVWPAPHDLARPIPVQRYARARVRHRACAGPAETSPRPERPYLPWQ